MEYTFSEFAEWYQRTLEEMIMLAIKAGLLGMARWSVPVPGAKQMERTQLGLADSYRKHLERCLVLYARGDPIVWLSNTHRKRPGFPCHETSGRWAIEDQ